jgi:5-methylcytosine-specific restriction protein A
MASTWNITPGEVITRDEIADRCGGDHRYRGIVPFDGNVAVYSDHEKGKTFGYNYDGWDAHQEVYFYTGQGANGDQQLIRGNRAIADHKLDNKALRLLIAVGNAGDSGTRMHRYVGQFELDTEVPYITRTAPGEDGVPRKVFVFRLLPVGEVVTDAAQPSVIDGVAAASSAETVSVEAVPEAVVKSERAEFERTGSVTAEQKEASLTARFRVYLESHGREVKRYKITTPVGVFFTDTADVTAGVLYEAKGTAERMSVRLALGQVLDYGRFVPDQQLAVLLPSPPSADLVELLESHNVGCVVETTLGQFADMTGLGRCP